MNQLFQVVIHYAAKPSRRMVFTIELSERGPDSNCSCEKNERRNNYISLKTNFPGNINNLFTRIRGKSLIMTHTSRSDSQEAFPFTLNQKPRYGHLKCPTDLMAKRLRVITSALDNTLKTPYFLI
jgi:hypothetical protein